MILPIRKQGYVALSLVAIRAPDRIVVGQVHRAAHIVCEGVFFSGTPFSGGALHHVSACLTATDPLRQPSTTHRHRQLSRSLRFVADIFGAHLHRLHANERRWCR